MRYELADYEWAAINSMVPNKPRCLPRVNDRRVLNGLFWVLRSVRLLVDVMRERVRQIDHLVIVMRATRGEPVEFPVQPLE
jgi:transposase